MGERRVIIWTGFSKNAVWPNSYDPGICFERLSGELPEYESRVSPPQQPVQVLLSVPIDSIKSNRSTGNCAV